MKKLLAACGLLLLAARPGRFAAEPAPAPKVPGEVAVLRSEETFRALGWRSRWEWQGAVNSLRAMGLKVDIIEARSLEARGCPVKVLILPNSRNLSLKTVAAVERHLQAGGRLLATYQSSYRKPDNTPWNPNNFALSRHFGARFKRFAGTAPEAGRMLWEDGDSIELPRHQSMIFEPLEGTAVLATWDRPEKAPAVIESAEGIYCGEDLLAPELSASPVVRQRLAFLLHRLDPTLNANSKVGRPLVREAPRLPFLAFPAQGFGQDVRIGLGALTGERLVVRPHSGAPGSEISIRWRGDGHLLVTRANKTTDVPEITLRSPAYLDVWTDFSNGTYRWQALRGALECKAQPDGVGMVNVLALDAYLAGVIPSEVPFTFPEESLKAMAVVARTFTLSHLGRHKASGFDLCSEVHCQVYRGLAAESQSTTRAVLATLDETLRYAGKPADTTFSACCGGEGEGVEQAWPRSGAQPYLPGTVDAEGPQLNLTQEADLRAWMDNPPAAYCSRATRFRWEETLLWKDLQDRLQQSLPVLLGPDYRSLGELQNVSVAQRDKTGHVTSLVLQGTLATFTVGNDAVRWLTSGGRAGAGGLNSSLFYLDSILVPSGRALQIRGAGWGHGVGMCQEGAAGRALVGQSYSQILSHYYPGTTLAKDSEPLPTPVVIPEK